jgi:hypothetical protein
VSWRHVLESALGTAVTLVMFMGGRRIVAQLVFKGIKAAVDFRRRTR